MTPLVKRLLFWTPRLLCVAFALFLGLSSIDTFGERFTFAGILPTLAIHLIPTVLLIIILMLSWKWEWVGGVMFFVLSLMYFFATVGTRHWSAWGIISGGLFVLGFLFAVDWIYRDQLHAKA